MSEVQSARAEILSRIRSTINASRGNAAETWQAIPRNYRQNSTLTSSEKMALLEDRLQDYGAGVHHAESSQLASAIATVLHQRNKKRILVPRDISTAWLPAGFTFVPDENASYEAMDACDGVLTGCLLAIASTGTLALCHEHGQGRRALTLIPDYHLCVVESSAVVETVPEAIHLLESRKQHPITLISGPSATADIEMTRIQGVHGPRVLDVVFIP